MWTADPLVRGNAFFNLVKLGATMVAYHENFYGVLEDGFNAGDSDRVVLRWDLASDRAVHAADGRPTPVAPTRDASSCARTRTALRRPRRRAATSCSRGCRRHRRAPREIPSARARGALALRDTVGRALADGFRAEAITRDGWLVLRR